MAQEVIIELKAETTKARKQLEELTGEVSQLRKEQAEQSKEAVSQAKETSKGIGGISKAFKGMGVALKAAGIGLIIAAFSKLTEVFSQNQKVADAMSTIFETVSLVFNEVVNVVLDVIDSVSQATGGFDALGKVMKAMITLAFTPIKLSFYAIKLGILAAQLAWEDSFLGNEDPATIRRLNKEIKETKKNISDVAVAAANAGKDIYNNFGEAIGEIGSVVGGVVDGISQISIAGAAATAKANVDLKNSAMLAAAEQGRLVEQYDRDAEKLRQIRDEERLSIEERKQANNDLLQVLEAQEKAMLKQADAQIASARADLDKNASIENQIALTEALANREGVLAQLEGLRSEQKSNDLALDREEVELTNSKLESESLLSIERQRFNAEQITDEYAKLEALKEIALLEQEQETLRLQNIVDNANAGTQAKVDAQIALDDFTEASRQKNIDADTALNAAKIELGKKELETKRKQADQIVGVLGDLQAIAGEETAAGKALGIAMATINTYRGVSDALAATTVTPFETALKFVNAGAILASGLKNVKQIIGVKIPKVKGASAPSGGGSVPSAPTITAPSAPPSFNVVGASDSSQLAGVIANQSQQPIQAYVVSNDVTTAQSLDRNIIESVGI
jgi:hypothetical protein